MQGALSLKNSITKRKKIKERKEKGRKEGNKRKKKVKNSGS
jgi:hypothetical protein